MQGNAVDRTVFLLFILLGIFILVKRRLNWSAILKQNWLILLFLVFCGLSVMWSDFAAVSFKRWVKGLGDYVMALVVMTETMPAEALKTIIRRCAIILIPFSILLIRYYPYGRIFTPWGQGEYVGVATSKNTLGTLCLVFGLYLAWSLLTRQTKSEGVHDKKELYGYLFYAFLILMLFKYAPSMTSIMCLTMGAVLLWVMKSRIVRRNARHFTYIFLYFILVVIMVQMVVDMIPGLLTTFGRDVTLTGRIPLWEYLLEMDLNVWFGAGYESFWLGDRLQDIWEMHWWMPNQAHNGFLETYLNLGRIGLFLIVGILFTAYRKALKGLEDDYDFSVFSMIFLFIIVVFNQFEAAFKALHIMWFLLLLFSIRYKDDSIRPKISFDKRVG
jgi:O-antigen ligase